MGTQQTRRIARETALQFLYQEDFTVAGDLRHGYDLDDRFPLFCSLYQVNKKARAYAAVLIAGVCDNLEEIDRKVDCAAQNWRLERLAATDRNLLRIAAYEMLFYNVPGQVAINEALEIAKKYANEDAPKFINGVLGRLMKMQQGEPGDSLS